MDRLVLRDGDWERMAALIIGRPDQKGSTGRDLPEVFGEWNSVVRRFSRWSRKGVWQRIFEAMSEDPDFEYLIVEFDH